MIIFFESGRLGNQLFQYVALRSFFPKPEKIILIGFDSLKNTFDGVDAIFIPKNIWLMKIFVKIVRKLEHLNVLDKIFNVAYESSLDEKIIIKKNLTWLNYIYVKESYFQSETFISDDVVNQLSFKSHITEALASDPRFGEQESNLIFLHVRRGDYLSWPSPEFPAVLSEDWYLRQVNIIKSFIDAPKFLFFTDDPEYVKEKLLHQIDCADIYHSSESMDLAAMSYCCGGVLSPSSYAWWGAKFSISKGRGMKKFIAPTYWIGHASKNWIPPKIKAQFIEYFD